MLRIEEIEIDREVTKSTSRLSGFADNFWMGFREGRGDEGRFPIVPGTFAKRERDGSMIATPLGELYVALDGAITLETTLDSLKSSRLISKT
jgi:hypothetical protein